MRYDYTEWDGTEFVDQRKLMEFFGQVMDFVLQYGQKADSKEHSTAEDVHTSRGVGLLELASDLPSVAGTERSAPGCWPSPPILHPPTAAGTAPATPGWRYPPRAPLAVRIRPRFPVR